MPLTVSVSSGNAIGCAFCRADCPVAGIFSGCMKAEERLARHAPETKRIGFVENWPSASNECVASGTEPDVSDKTDSSGWCDVPHRFSKRVEEAFAILLRCFPTGIPNLRETRHRAGDQTIAIAAEDCANDSVARWIGHENRIPFVDPYIPIPKTNVVE